MEPSEDPLSTQCTQGKPLAKSSTGPKAKNPRGLRPLRFLALDVASGSPFENPMGDLQSSP